MVSHIGHPDLWELYQKDELSECLAWGTNQADVWKSQSAIRKLRFPSWRAEVWSQLPQTQQKAAVTEIISEGDSLADLEASARGAGHS